MPRYIDCGMACAEVDKGDLLVGNNAEFAKEIINRTPSADVVEVVRCKECIYYLSLGEQYQYKDRPAMHCFCHGRLTSEDGYCNEGIRRPDPDAVPKGKTKIVGKFTCERKEQK